MHLCSRHFLWELRFIVIPAKESPLHACLQDTYLLHATSYSMITWEKNLFAIINLWIVLNSSFLKNHLNLNRKKMLWLSSIINHSFIVRVGYKRWKKVGGGRGGEGTNRKRKRTCSVLCWSKDWEEVIVPYKQWRLSTVLLVSFKNLEPFPGG